jgi:hypothetical protein
MTAYPDYSVITDSMMITLKIIAWGKLGITKMQVLRRVGMIGLCEFTAHFLGYTP